MKLVKVDFDRKPPAVSCCKYHTALAAAMEDALMHPEDDQDINFLCKTDYSIFVSKAYLLKIPDGHMPANCPELGCLYVSPGDNDSLVPLDELNEMYLIVEWD